MKIQSIQPNQQTFGTKVKIDAHTARMFSLSEAKNKILREIEQLENNGNSDVLSLARTYGEEYCISASVLKEDNGRLFVSFPAIEKFVTLKKGKTQKYLSIKDLYKDAKTTFNEVILNKNDYKQFIPYIG